MLSIAERHKSTSIARALVLCALVIVSGCGSGENIRPLSGSVTLQGKPLERGIITLYPKGLGSTVGCEIIDGKYSLDDVSGATPGKYRVEINAFRPTGKTEFDVDQQKKVSIEEQYLPKQYNTNSTLEADVTADGENVFDYDLQLGK